jgi:hypothetical protein
LSLITRLKSRDGWVGVLPESWFCKKSLVI